jgi:hypothetical protein
MSVQSALKSLSTLEISTLVVFAFYLIMPIQMPAPVANMVDSPLGMLGIFLITIFLFFNANPLLAILYVFVAYELMRRSSNVTGRVEMVRYTPSQIKKDSQMKAMNPKKTKSLEEDVVEQMAPIGHSDISVYSTSTFKPVAEKIGTASLY